MKLVAIWIMSKVQLGQSTAILLLALMVVVVVWTAAAVVWVNNTIIIMQRMDHVHEHGRAGIDHTQNAKSNVQTMRSFRATATAHHDGMYEKIPTAKK